MFVTSRSYLFESTMLFIRISVQNHWQHSFHFSQLEVIDHVMNMTRPAIYSREIAVIDFEDIAGIVNPTYFGMVRDPVERFKSSFLFYRSRK